MSDHKASRPMPEQITYANILFLGAWTGIALLVVTYFIYLTGILEPHSTIRAVIDSWTHGVHHYQQATDAPSGWGWAALLNTGDYLNFIGLALMALLTIVCYLVLLPGFIRQRDWTYTIICVLEVLVLCLAASGLLGSGGH
ncbi:DUF1634 domain-containing protein [Desulfohalovibrio reitneri]|uniref:DUF1634 domain-containing protein n=1 Tax=Desulfohalovibrio reitneri TaxID=1307759 RepID=UPI0004A6DCF8|nr:DUF1634 domain-containing protein [Desulfohalovibrio reitneri]